MHLLSSASLVLIDRALVAAAFLSVLPGTANAQPADTAASVLLDVKALPKPCRANSPTAKDEIVICARPQSRFRLEPLPAEEKKQALPRAEFGLWGDAQAKITAEKGNVGPIPTNRIVVKVKIPF